MNRKVREYTVIALFPALMAATAGIVIPLGSLPPITLQTLFVYLSGLLLGAKKASLSMFIYVIMGAIGLPVFSGYQGGIGILLGFKGGFIISFIIVAFMIGFIKNVKFINNDFWNNFLVLLIGTILIYMIGAAYISFLTTANIWLVLGGFYIYLIGDFLKIFTALYVHVRIRSHVTYEHP